MAYLDEFSPIVAAHKHSSRHRLELERSALAGCFYCLETFPSAEVEEWLDDDDTALCPKCGIDSVIGDKSGYPLTREFLQQMHQHWF